jgi:type II secretory pathway component HofQ
MSLTKKKLNRFYEEVSKTDFQSKKVTIRIAGLLKGKINNVGVRILIPFNTSKSVFADDWKNIPRFGQLLFTAQLTPKGVLEYVFSGVQIKCYCNGCIKLTKQKHES